MAHFAFGLNPICSAQTVEARSRSVRANIARDAVCLMNRNVEHVIILVLNGQIFALVSVDVGFMQADKLTDAVVDMDNVIAGFEIGKNCFGSFRAHRRTTAWLRSAPTEDFAVSQEMMAAVLIESQYPSAGKRAFDEAISSNFLIGMAFFPELFEAGSLTRNNRPRLILTAQLVDFGLEVF